MKRMLWIAVLGMLFPALVMGQNKSLSNVMKVETKSVGYIMEMDKLTGYYAFYRNDKVDKKNDSYLLDLMDDNFTSVKVIDIIQPKGSYLLEIVFNGKAFMLMFFKDDNITLINYDKAGKKLGEKFIEDVNKWEKFRIKTAQEQGAVNTSLYPLSDGGFVRQTLVKNDNLGYEVEAYDNNMKVLWTHRSEATSKFLEAADVVFSSKEMVLINVGKKTGLMSKKLDSYLIGIDGVNGTKKFEYPLQDQSDLSLLSCIYDSTKKEVIASGEYYAPGDDQGKSSSQGIYFLTLTESGQKNLLKKLSWNYDLAKIKPVDAKAKSNTSVYFHRMIRTNEGKTFAIGEQYKKTASAMGIASVALSGGRGNASAASVHVYNMVVLEFDPSFNVTNYNVFDKKKSEVLLPAGAAYYSSAFLALYIKSMGGFDYQFTSVDRDRNRFYSIYKDVNRKDDDGKKADSMIGTISYEDGKMITNRFPLNTEGSNLWIHPAKPGFIAITEYFRKKKMITMRLEKINY